MNNNIKVQISINEEMVAKLKKLLNTREDATMDSLVQQCFERGVKDLDYRTDRNRRVYQENKQLLKLAKEMLQK